jgi:hypothetical protein
VVVPLSFFAIELRARFIDETLATLQSAKAPITAGLSDTAMSTFVAVQLALSGCAICLIVGGLGALWADRKSGQFNAGSQPPVAADRNAGYHSR